MSESKIDPSPGTHIEKWGYSFTWTEQHLTHIQTDPLQQEFDVLADQALEKLQALKALTASQSETGRPPESDLYEILKANHQQDDVLHRFWDQVHVVPDWVDWQQLERAQAHFPRYALPHMIGFALQAFLAEASASSRVVEVLVRTGGFSTSQLLRRLLNTFQWLAQITSDLPSIQPGGDAHVATVRVRLLHASVRARIRILAAKDPQYFDLQNWGLPCNDLDQIHTISTFSSNQLWLHLPRLGITPTDQEIVDYVALFRYIGYILGVPPSYFERPKDAKLLMESLCVTDLQVTETSRTVAYNFIQCVANLPWPFHISGGFLEAGSRWINGDDLSDQLNLGHPSYLQYMAFVGQYILSVELAWAQRLVPAFDEFMVSFIRKLLREGLIERKQKTRFGFKWIPQIGKMTVKEASKGNPKSTIAKYWATVTEMGPIEVFFLSVVFTHAVSLLLFSWLAVGLLQSYVMGRIAIM
ncbi:hypothetical protein N7470_007145 [Penicillium chermesinum]|nr:hypothetical protein N7470_007145 [Penicillium chermesinum]